MGIDVSDDRIVVVNNNHDRLVVTCPTKNPSYNNLGGLPIYSIYRRVMAKDRSGDGNPFIFALKRIRKYNISISEIKKLIPGFRIILDKILTEDFDLIVPMPSGHKISSIIANRILRHTGVGIISNDLLKKKTNGDIAAELRRFMSANPTRFSKYKQEVISLLKILDSNSTSSFKMKAVNPKIRTFVQPISLAYIPTTSAARILLVDDLVSTGSTLTSARDQLLTAYPGAHIEALCLLSEATKR